MASDNDLHFSNIVNLDAIFKEVLRGTQFNTSRAFRSFAKDFASSAEKQRLMKPLNQKIAKGAQAAVVEAYDAAHRGQPSYRHNDPRSKRRSNGRMKNALQHRSFIQSDAHGIYFGSIKTLDETAAQWYRLNFGTKPRGQKRAPGVGTMKFFGRKVSQSVSLRGYGPSKAFTIPGTMMFSSEFVGGGRPGGFVAASASRRGSDALYFRRKSGTFGSLSQRGISAGIRGTRFLDAGPKYINENYGRGVTQVIRTWFDDAKKKM
jgi:hypothetical protein